MDRMPPNNYHSPPTFPDPAASVADPNYHRSLHSPPRVRPRSFSAIALLNNSSNCIPHVAQTHGSKI